MDRTSIYEKRLHETGPRPDDRRNEVAAAFHEFLDAILRESILPGAFGTSFTRDEAPLYVPKRRLLSKEVLSENMFLYEELLHRHYWFDKEDGTQNLLVVEAGEGVGKSTLLRFYFDCYLRHYGDFPHRDEGQFDARAWTEQLSRHVILYSDLRYGSSLSDANRQMSADLRRRIAQLFPQLASEQEYAMWSRVAHWDEQLHRDAEKSHPSRVAYRANYIGEFAKNDSVYVREALWYLCRQQTPDKQRKYFLTLICDNLDQQTPDVQQDFIRGLLSWFYRSAHNPDMDLINIWRLIVPLRPETLRIIRPVLEPLSQAQVLPIGSVDDSALLESRAGETVKSILASRRQIDHDIMVGQDKAPVCRIVPNLMAAALMHGMLTVDISVGRGSKQVKLDLRQYTRLLLEHFCNGSIRRFLRLRRRLAMSLATRRAISHARVGKKPAYIPHYVFLDAVLTGGRDHFDKNDAQQDLLNLYDMVTCTLGAYALLIGPHMLHLLARRQWSSGALVEALVGIGYTELAVHECIEAFWQKGIVRRGPAGADGDYNVYPEMPVVNAFAELLVNPAYTDHMALVTPVEPEFWGEMDVTSASIPEDFFPRAKTTLAFLRQVRKDEARVAMYSSGLRGIAELETLCR